jgi:hypothetical protein
MDRKEYHAMMEEKKRRRKKTDVAAVEGEAEEELVEELDQEHERHCNHEGVKNTDANVVGSAKEVPVIPKKPLNGYMRYVAEIREAVTTEFPELTGKDLVSLLVLLVFVCQLFAMLTSCLSRL